MIKICQHWSHGQQICQHTNTRMLYIGIIPHSYVLYLQTLSQRTGKGNCSFNKHLKKLSWQLLLKYLFGTWETQIHVTLLKQELQCCLLLNLPYPQEKPQSPKKRSSEEMNKEKFYLSWEVLSRAFWAKLTFSWQYFHQTMSHTKEVWRVFIKRQWNLLMRSNNGALLKDVD